MEFQLPKGFLMGTASAADQIEGGDVDSNWNDWHARGKIHDNTSPAIADDHWNRWKEDCDLMKELGLQITRIGVEWPRIEPAEGQFCQDVIERYREEILYLKSLGIKPLLTLHHFGNPMWFENKGAFLKKENLPLFLDFCYYVIDKLGDIVSDYITINEPNVYTMNGYLGGDWPPGRNSFGEYFRVLSNMASCHIILYKEIHKRRKALGFNDTMVSFANHMRVFAPKKANNLWHKVCCSFAEFGFQGAFSKAMMTGTFSFPLKNEFKLPKGDYADFIGINYYSRSAVSGLADGSFDNVARNDLNWEIYPKGIVLVAEKLYAIAKKPIWITENGTCDNFDAFRAKYIAQHLEEISKSSLPFERYYHWCFCDNFEWMEGQSARFGIVHIDYETQKRTIKESARFFSEVIKAQGVNNQIYEKYIKDEKYRVE